MNHATPQEPTPMIDPLQNLNFSHLFYFWAVARDGSIANACERLQVTQPTVSMQIRQLEKSLGHPLFERSGRRLALSDVGRTVFEYADDIFATGRELLGALRGTLTGRTPRLHVGVPKVLPKLITYRLLEPVLHLPRHVQIVCEESEMDDLVANLARHRFDVILTDTPISSNMRVRSFNHLLGECSIAICGVSGLARRYRRKFPESLDGAPILLPTPGTDIRRAMDRWLDSQNFSPRIVGEFDDFALLKEFGLAGAGLFPVPSAVLREVKQQYRAELLGHVPNSRLRYYAITTERRITHPAVAAITEVARQGLLAQPDGEAH